jgi:hypothetical protein
LSKEASLLWTLQEEVANLPEDEGQVVSPFALALEGKRSTLAASLKTIFEDITHQGEKGAI